MYVREYERPTEDAFAELEAVVGVKGRRFYGVFDVGAGRYWVCVRRREEDDPARLGLKAGTIAGGLYASARLRGDYDALIALIAPTFEEMTARHDADRRGLPSSSIDGTTSSCCTFPSRNRHLPRSAS